MSTARGLVGSTALACLLLGGGAFGASVGRAGASTAVRIGYAGSFVTVATVVRFGRPADPLEPVSPTFQGALADLERRNRRLGLAIDRHLRRLTRRPDRNPWVQRLLVPVGALREPTWFTMRATPITLRVFEPGWASSSASAELRAAFPHTWLHERLAACALSRAISDVDPAGRARVGLGELDPLGGAEAEARDPWAGIPRFGAGQILRWTPEALLGAGHTAAAVELAGCQKDPAPSAWFVPYLASAERVVREQALAALVLAPDAREVLEGLASERPDARAALVLFF